MLTGTQRLWVLLITESVNEQNLPHLSVLSLHSPYHCTCWNAKSSITVPNIGTSVCHMLYQMVTLDMSGMNLPSSHFLHHLILQTLNRTRVSLPASCVWCRMWCWTGKSKWPVLYPRPVFLSHALGWPSIKSHSLSHIFECGSSSTIALMNVCIPYCPSSCNYFSYLALLV